MEGEISIEEPANSHGQPLLPEDELREMVAERLRRAAPMRRDGYAVPSELYFLIQDVVRLQCAKETLKGLFGCTFAGAGTVSKQEAFELQRGIEKLIIRYESEIRKRYT